MKERVAFVIDTLATRGGAERVLEASLEMFPDAPIYTLVYSPLVFSGTTIARHTIHTSFINRLPGARKNYRSYLGLLPMAIEQFDLRAYPIVLSSSYAVAHGVLTRPDQLHITYKHTPLRQAWHYHFAYLTDAHIRSGPKSWLARSILHYLRLWDVAAATRVDKWVVNSHWVAQGVWKAYRRTAEVVYPPVDVEGFQPLSPRQDYFICVSRLVLHKKVDLVVKTFSSLGYPLLVVGDGEEYKNIARQAASNVKLLGRQPEAVVHELVGKARAFVLAGEEDFSIAAVEAQAAGCPVIAYGKGGVCETIIEGETGLFFNEQTVESLVEAVERFKQLSRQFDAHLVRQNALRFNKKRFQDELLALVEREWDRFEGGITGM
jgi:glycosyltransferase involved in cell wall biosynthesis